MGLCREMKKKIQRVVSNQIFILIATTVIIGVGFFFTINLIPEIFFNSQLFIHAHHDFLAFYSAAAFIFHGQADQLFNANAMATFQYDLIHERVGAAGYMAYMTPPFAATLLAPLAITSLFKARIIWFLFNFVLAILIILNIVKPISGRKKYLSVILLLLTFPIYQTWVEGQVSLLILASSLVALNLYQKEKLVLSGIFFSGLSIKLQMLVPVFFGFILFRQWKVVLGIIMGTFLLICLALPFTGVQSYIHYFQYLLGVTNAHFNGAGQISSHSSWHGNIQDMFGINALWVGIFGQKSTSIVNLFTSVSITGLLGLFLITIQKVKPGFQNINQQIMLVTSIALIFLTNIHLFAQDLVMVLLIIPIVLKYFKNPLYLILLIAFLMDIAAIDLLLHIHLFPLILSVFILLTLLRTMQGKNLSSPFMN